MTLPGRVVATFLRGRADGARRKGDASEAQSRRCWCWRTAGRSAARRTAAVGETFGEAVFTTGMTGYQETLTDPSYHRQVVVHDRAAHRQHRRQRRGRRVRPDLGGRLRGARPGPAAVELARHRRAWRTSWPPQGVVGISGVDTRALTRHLRERGAMRVGVSSVDADPAALLARVLAAPRMVGADLSAEVTHRRAVRGRRPRASTGSRSPRSTSASSATRRGGWPRAASTTHVLPATSTVDDLLAVEPGRGVLLERPRRPGHRRPRRSALARAVLRAPDAAVRHLLRQPDPRPGAGFGTYKLRYGHRGINQPVLDRATGKVEVTAHNHGFAVDAPLDGPIDTDVRRGRGQPRLPQRRRGRGAALPGRAGVHACSTTRRRRPARTTPTTCSTGSSS